MQQQNNRTTSVILSGPGPYPASGAPGVSQRQPGIFNTTTGVSQRQPCVSQRNTFVPKLSPIFDLECAEVPEFDEVTPIKIPKVQKPTKPKAKEITLSSRIAGKVIAHKESVPLPPLPAPKVAPAVILSAEEEMTLDVILRELELNDPPVPTPAPRTKPPLPHHKPSNNEYSLVNILSEQNDNIIEEDEFGSEPSFYDHFEPLTPTPEVAAETVELNDTVDFPEVPAPTHPEPVQYIEGILNVYEPVPIVPAPIAPAPESPWIIPESVQKYIEGDKDKTPEPLPVALAKALITPVKPIKHKRRKCITPVYTEPEKTEEKLSNNIESQMNKEQIAKIKALTIPKAISTIHNLYLAFKCHANNLPCNQELLELKWSLGTTDLLLIAAQMRYYVQQLSENKRKKLAEGWDKIYGEGDFILLDDLLYKYEEAYIQLPLPVPKKSKKPVKKVIKPLKPQQQIVADNLSEDEELILPDPKPIVHDVTLSVETQQKLINHRFNEEWQRELEARGEALVLAEQIKQEIINKRFNEEWQRELETRGEALVLAEEIANKILRDREAIKYINNCKRIYDILNKTTPAFVEVPELDHYKITEKLVIEIEAEHFEPLPCPPVIKAAAEPILEKENKDEDDDDDIDLSGITPTGNIQEKKTKNPLHSIVVNNENLTIMFNVISDDVPIPNEMRVDCFKKYPLHKCIKNYMFLHTKRLENLKTLFYKHTAFPDIIVNIIADEVYQWELHDLALYRYNENKLYYLQLLYPVEYNFEQAQKSPEKIKPHYGTLFNTDTWSSIQSISNKRFTYFTKHMQKHPENMQPMLKLLDKDDNQVVKLIKNCSINLVKEHLPKNNDCITLYENNTTVETGEFDDDEEDSKLEILPAPTEEELENAHNSLYNMVDDQKFESYDWEAHIHFCEKYGHCITSPIPDELNDTVNFPEVEAPPHAFEPHAFGYRAGIDNNSELIKEHNRNNNINNTSTKKKWRIKAAAEPKLEKFFPDEPDSPKIPVGCYMFPSVDDLDELTRRYHANKFDNQPRIRKNYVPKVKNPYNNEEIYYPVSPSNENENEEEKCALVDIDIDLIGGMFRPIPKATAAENARARQEMAQRSLARQQARERFNMNLTDQQVEQQARAQPPPLEPLPEGDFIDPDFAQFEREFKEEKEEKQAIVPFISNRRRKRFARVNEIRQRDENETITIRRDQLNRARNLNIQPFSSWLTDIYQYSIKITNNSQLTYIAFKFNYPVQPINYAVLSLPKQFMQRTLGLEQFVRAVLGSQGKMFKFLVYTDSEVGQYARSTTFNKDWQRSLQLLYNSLQEVEDGYEYVGVRVIGFEVHIMPRIVVGGQSHDAGTLKNRINEKLGEIKDRYYVINPKSRYNCLWTCCAIAVGYHSNEKLLNDKETQKKAGVYLKKAIGTRNYKAGMAEDIQKIAQYKNIIINVRNNFNEITHTFGPEGGVFDDVIEILLMDGHFNALIPKPNDYISAILEKELNKTKITQCIPIEAGNINQNCLRIVSYDLESYKYVTKFHYEGDKKIEDEYEQIAYAVGWAFRCNDEEEETTALQGGYTILKYKWDNQDMVVAYKYEIDENPTAECQCINRALNEWLTNKLFHKAVLYAHNGGKFDLRLILGQSNIFRNERWSIYGDKTIELNGRIINMEVANHDVMYTVKNKKGRSYQVAHQITFKDSLCILQGSLAKMTHDLNVPHPKMEEKVAFHEQIYKDTMWKIWNDNNLAQYLQNDVVGLLEVLLKFNEECVTGTGIPITSINTGASLAKKYYLNNHYNPYETDEKGETILQVDEAIYTLTPEFDEFIRAGYGGGRCEAFISMEYNENCYYYDYTSLYPDVGRKPMPVGCPKWVIEPGTEEEENKKAKLLKIWKRRIYDKETNGQTGFWKVRVWSPNGGKNTTKKPLFGMKEEGMYLFRWHTEKTVMTIYEKEILFAIEHKLDYEFEPINGVLFNEKPVLQSCMEHLFKAKKSAKEQGQEALSNAWKIIINSLYGVWGLKTLNREGVEMAKAERSNWAIDLANEKLIDIRRMGDYIITRRQKDLEVKDCNVAIAAAVTSEARMKLYTLFIGIDSVGGKVLYCDTDSVITNVCIENHPQLRDQFMGPTLGKELGSLKNEIGDCYKDINKALVKIGKEPLQPKYHFSKAIIIAPKLYVVYAEDGLIMKKAHKGYKADKCKIETEGKEEIEQSIQKYKENSDHFYSQMYRLIDPNLPVADRIMTQKTIQWLGGNADLLKGQVGVRNVLRDKKIKRIVRKGKVVDGIVQPFSSKEELLIHQQEVKHYQKQFK